MADTTETKTSALEDFRDEFRRVWEQMPDKGLFFGLLAAWLALFHFLGNSTFGYVDTPSLLGWMSNAYNTAGSEDSHGNLIPLVVLVLFWWKRQDLLALPKRTWWPGLGLVALALGLHIVGYTVQQPRVSIVAMFLGIYGLMGLVWGWAWLRGSFFPFALFAFCVPIGSLAESLTFPLRMVATKITVALGQTALGIPVIQDGVRIFDPNGAYAYEVAAACSGIRSLISLTALTTIYGFITFKAAWKQGLFVVLAAPLALLNNILRLTTIIIAAEAFGQGAGEFVDRWFGFLTFALALAIVLVLGHWLREQRPVPGPAPALKPQSA
jgi:exosortase